MSQEEEQERDEVRAEVTADTLLLPLAGAYDEVDDAAFGLNGTSAETGHRRVRRRAGHNVVLRFRARLLATTSFALFVCSCPHSL